jgi:UDP-3-O-[3-hydroxymyristoyl] glucosamine N-acyltransferase
MADPRFFDRQGPFALRDILARTELAGIPDVALDRQFTDVGALESAEPESVSFLDNPKYLSAFKDTRAGACFVDPTHVDHCPRDTLPIITATPYLAFAQTAALFYPGDANIDVDVDVEGPNVHSTAKLGKKVTVGPSATIGAHAEIGEGTTVAGNVHIGRGVVIGKNCILHHSATVTHALIGDRVDVGVGVRIGQRGFGFALNPPGYIAVPQLGRVVIGNDVNIGANTTIDRGAGPDTRIGDHCQIDNLVQIAHNVVLGQGCVLASQVGISGSTKVGDYVVMAGQVGLAGHLNIADGVTLAGKTGVTRDLTNPGTYGGFPAVPVREWRIKVATLNRLARKRDRNDG